MKIRKPVRTRFHEFKEQSNHLFKEEPIKKILTTLAIAALTFGAYAEDPAQTQTKSLEQIKAEVQTQIKAEIAENEQLQTRLQEAKAAVDAAREAVKKMNKGEVSKEEVEAAKTMTQARLQNQLENAIKALGEAAEDVEAAQEQVQKRLQDKAAELKQIQDRIQAKDGSCDGSGSQQGKN